jgi:AcrR family transcriptional regulator
VSRKTARRQELRRRKPRVALLAAELKLLAERPIEGVSVEDITQHAGVAKGSFFNHFADKNEFASAIASEICSGIETRLALANQKVADPALRIAQAICSVIQFACAQRLAAKLSSESTLRTPAQLNRSTPAFAPLLRVQPRKAVPRKGTMSGGRAPSGRSR